MKYLICNNEQKPPLRFFVSQILHCIRNNSSKRLIQLCFLFLRGKIFFCPYRLASKKVVSWLRRKQFDIGLHAMGVIYKKEVIETFKLGIINPHIGKLPEMRGRSVMEWSIFYNIPTGVSSFFIDSGIDTGPNMLFFEPYLVPYQGSIGIAKAYLFSRDLEIFKKSLTFLLNNKPLKKNDVILGKRYYVMSQFMSEIVNQKLCRS